MLRVALALNRQLWIVGDVERQVRVGELWVGWIARWQSESEQEIARKGAEN